MKLRDGRPGLYHIYIKGKRERVRERERERDGES